MSFSLLELPYSYDSLEPHIDAKTMEIHFTKHHQAYCDKLNESTLGTPLEHMSIEEILAVGPKELPTAVRNAGGGFSNHNLFWKMMNPKGGGNPTGDLAVALTETFESFENFKQLFAKAAIAQFGSGWAWLVMDGGNLEILQTANQDSPLMFGKTPLLGVDVWEHAYYLKYQNRRAEYLSAWWNVVDWNQTFENFLAAKSDRARRQNRAA